VDVSGETLIVVVVINSLEDVLSASLETADSIDVSIDLIEVRSVDDVTENIVVSTDETIDSVIDSIDVESVGAATGTLFITTDSLEVIISSLDESTSIFGSIEVIWVVSGIDSVEVTIASVVAVDSVKVKSDCV